VSIVIEAPDTCVLLCSPASGDAKVLYGQQTLKHQLAKCLRFTSANAAQEKGKKGNFCCPLVFQSLLPIQYKTGVCQKPFHLKKIEHSMTQNCNFNIY
jgi:hypothetical protein